MATSREKSSSESDAAVSVVISTYNRSNVLACAVESLLAQTMTDWEAWIIGDACTDDTEEVVRSFDDPRLHFFNQAENTGEQSGPNNEGVRRSRGRSVAYLNHDDLWFPDHLETAVAGLEETGADMVFTLLAVARQGEGRWKPNRLPSAAPGLRYHPRIQVPASCWVARRKLLDRIGPWRFYQECRVPPSQDWLFRAWRANGDLRLVPRLTVVSFPSGKRRGSYVDREDREQRDCLQRIRTEPDIREQILTEVAAGFRMSWIDLQAPDVLVRQALWTTLEKIFLKFGVHPQAVRNFMRFPRKGQRIDSLRRTRGLERLPRRRRRGSS